MRKLLWIAVAAGVLGSLRGQDSSTNHPPSPVTPAEKLPEATRATPGKPFVLDRPRQLRLLQGYIQAGWHTLQRSDRDLATAAVDPKLKAAADHRWPVYLSRQEDITQIRERVRQEMRPVDFARIELRYLPENTADIQEHGLLYLPYPYVVPGGRFNEMYGWDSYFIAVGLLRAGEVDLAKQMVDNFLYEIDQYGKILNANRTYYLTRSQPPFLTRMILGVYHQTKDDAWLLTTLPAVRKYYRYWTEKEHLTATGLSRYYDLGEGPSPEVLMSERDAQGKTHYERVREDLQKSEPQDDSLRPFYDREKNRLTDLFYKGDRSMRESGFDPSDRFGPVGMEVIQFNPVCLNTLLYVAERDTAEMLEIVGFGQEADQWTERASERKKKINALLWDDKDGLYYDYNFVRQEVRRYPFATTFFPLWAGLASPAQAKRLVANLPLFERPGGLRTSTTETGSQWDAPYGWAPLQLIAVEGLRRYGYQTEADRISTNFLSLVLKEFIQSHTVVEKYDVERRSSEVATTFGYTTNEIGFGWTNAAFLELYAQLPERKRPGVLQLEGQPVPSYK